MLRILFFCCLIFGSNVLAQLRPAKIFNEHMVFQRESPVKIWGWATANEMVVGSFEREQQRTNADSEGYWELDFGIQAMGGPYELKIATASRKLDWQDIYVGDVWLCSGQSNMEWPVSQSHNAEKEIAAADLPLLRHFRVPKSAADSPQEDLSGGLWQVSNSTTAGAFSAVGYYFAKEIIESESVPIGLINASWGGARLEPFMSAQANRIEDLDAYLKMLKDRKNKSAEERGLKMKRKFKALTVLDDNSRKPAQQDWQSPTLDASLWPSMEIPTLWEEAGMIGFDGVVWYRKEVNLSREEVAQIKSLQLGPIDDSDQTWINGIAVGSMEQQYNVDRIYPLRSDVLKVGKNVIAVRVEDTGGGGGIYGAAEKIGFFGDEMIKALHGEWQINASMMYKVSDFQRNATPTVLYHQMIHPLIQFPIKGVLWYQGESNAGPNDAGVYRDQFRSLILNWRKDWQQEELPFFFVQLANFMKREITPTESSWALLRESQTKVLDMPKTGMAVTIDIGEADDIHPRNKQDVGKRLAAYALHKVYGDKDVIFSGPTLAATSLDKNLLSLTFEHADGLQSSREAIPGFAISGQDGQFQWIAGKIVGNSIVLDLSGVQNPRELRYAWADNPETDLYNAAGLPAVPFRITLSK